MANIPAGVNYGKVIEHLVTFSADTNDAGNEPDEQTLTGTATFTPSVTYARWPATTPPRSAVIKPIICPITDGDIYPPDGGVTPGVWLISTDQPGAEPDSIQWTVSYQITGASKQPPSKLFNVPTSGTLDLATVAPQQPQPGTITLVSSADRILAETARDQAVAAASSITGDISAVVDTWFVDHPGYGGATTVGQLTDAGTTGKLVVQGATASAIRTILGAGTSSLAIGTTSSTAKAGDYQPTSTNISDATTIGRQILVAADAAAVRTIINAGSSTLTIGTTSTTAKAGDYQPASTNITDATAIGKSMLTAADAAAVRTLLGTGTSNLAIGTTSTTAKAGNYAPAAADISDATATGRSIIQAASVGAVVTLLGMTADNTHLHLAGAESVTGVKTFTANPVFNDNAIPAAKVVGMSALSTPGNYYTIDYNPTTGWPLRNAPYGTLPSNAIVLWRGPIATPPPEAGGYALPNDDFQLVVP